MLSSDQKWITLKNKKDCSIMRHAQVTESVHSSLSFKHDAWRMSSLVPSRCTQNGRCLGRDNKDDQRYGTAPVRQTTEQSRSLQVEKELRGLRLRYIKSWRANSITVSSNKEIGNYRMKQQKFLRQKEKVRCHITQYIVKLTPGHRTTWMAKITRFRKVPEKFAQEIPKQQSVGN